MKETSEKDQAMSSWLVGIIFVLLFALFSKWMNRRVAGSLQEIVGPKREPIETSVFDLAKRYDPHFLIYFGRPAFYRLSWRQRYTLHKTTLYAVEKGLEHNPGMDVVVGIALIMGLGEEETRVCHWLSTHFQRRSGWYQQPRPLRSPEAYLSLISVLIESWGKIPVQAHLVH